MSDTKPAPSEQPAPDTAQVQAAGAQPTVTDPSTIAAGLDQQQLADLLYGDTPAPIAPVETTPAAPAAEIPPAAGEKPEAKPAEEKEGESSLRRLALGGIQMSERQKLAEVTRMLREGEATTTVEALQKLGAIQTTPPAAETPPANAEESNPPAPAAEQPATSTDIEQTIAELREQRKQARIDYDQDEEERLTSLIEDHGVALAEKRAEERIAAASNQTQAKSYQSSYLEAVDAMEAKYDWTTDETSPLYQALDDKVTAAQARKSPELQDPNYILKFADQIAEAFGKPATVAKPPAPPAAAPRIVGGGVAPGHSVAHQPSPEEVKAIVNSLTEEQLAAALYG